MRVLFFMLSLISTSVLMGCASTPDKVVVVEEKKVPCDLPQSTFTHFQPPSVASKDEYLAMEPYQREEYLAKKMVESVTVIGLANKRLDLIKKTYEDYLKYAGNDDAQSLKAHP